MLPAHISSTTKLLKSDPFLISLVSAGRDSPRLTAIKAAGLFHDDLGNPARPTNKQIIEAMHRLAREVYGVDPEKLELPTAENWLSNYRPGDRLMLHHEAFLLAAVFDLSVATFAAEDEEFRCAVKVAKSLRERGVSLAEGDFDVLRGLADIGEDKSVTIAVRPNEEIQAILSPTRALGRREPAVLVGERSTLKVDEFICFLVGAPPPFQSKCEIIILEKDQQGGVCCYVPSASAPQRPGGFTARDLGKQIEHILPNKQIVHILPPTDGGKFSFGMKGDSTIVAILNSGPPLRFGLNFEEDQNLTSIELHPLVDSLAMRDPATWRVVTHTCRIEQE